MRKPGGPLIFVNRLHPGCTETLAVSRATKDPMMREKAP